MRGLVLALLVVMATSLSAGATPVIKDLYRIDFEGVPAGPPPTGSGAFARDVLTGIVFGSPQVEAGPGGGQVLVLDKSIGQGQLEQVELELGLGGLAAGVLGYGLELDVFFASQHAAGLVPSRFAVLLDDPSSRSVVLDGNGVIHQTNIPLEWREIGSFEPGTWVHVSLFVDLNSRDWTIGVDGRRLASSPFVGGHLGSKDVTRARISLQSLGRGDRVLVDNIHSWAMVVPEPGSRVLGLTSVIALAWARRKRLAS